LGDSARAPSRTFSTAWPVGPAGTLGPGGYMGPGKVPERSGGVVASPAELARGRWLSDFDRFRNVKGFIKFARWTMRFCRSFCTDAPSKRPQRIFCLKKYFSTLFGNSESRIRESYFLSAEEMAELEVRVLEWKKHSAKASESCLSDQELTSSDVGAGQIDICNPANSITGREFRTAEGNTSPCIVTGQLVFTFPGQTMTSPVTVSSSYGMIPVLIDTSDTGDRSHSHQEGDQVQSVQKRYVCRRRNRRSSSVNLGEELSRESYPHMSSALNYVKRQAHDADLSARRWRPTVQMSSAG
jgi:hypothetical protein